MRRQIFAAGSNWIVPLATVCMLAVQWNKIQAFQHIGRPLFVFTTVTRYVPANQPCDSNRFHRVLDSTARNVHSMREADIIERMVGGVRYENVPMPMSMKSTTLFVSNLCEFAHDDDLSQLFQKVSKLQSVPACVVRKPDTTSLQYGFVAFPTVEEKEQAIIRFNNFEWRGKRLKVEDIKDTTKDVRIPERLVAYVTGGKALEYVSKQKKSPANTKSTLKRISRDDVERLSRGQASKQRGYGSRSVPHRLNDAERAELDRAARKGYLTLVGGGNRRARKGSPLVNIHRQWCDARANPQILLFKATGGGTVDEVVVDISPLRLNGMFDNPTQAEDFMVKWRAQTMTAAIDAGMDIREDTGDDDTDDIDDELCDSNDILCDENLTYTITLENTNHEAWATKPIWQLPVVNIGVFEGERSNAKSMAKTLADLWEIPEEVKIFDVPTTKGSKRDNKNYNKQTENRKRGGGHRQEWF